MIKTLPTHCVGIDGCKDGWVAVYCPTFSFKQAQAQHYRELSDLTNDFTPNSIIIIDIPIGLPNHMPNRPCDIEARKFLGHRSSTIFSPPCHDALYSTNYDEAKIINLKKTGKSISKQSWFLSKKIMETKNFIKNQNNFVLKEGHPECSFAQYNGKPIAENKKGMHGILKRLEILAKLEFNVPELSQMIPKETKVGIDDLLDASILCWTAKRLLQGESRTLPASTLANEKNDNEFFINV